jgi:hypothetical protein
MLGEESLKIIRAADEAGDADRAYQILRELPVDEFGELLLNASEFNVLSSFLPRMPPDQIQIAWTGAAGVKLLESSVSFIRCLDDAYVQNVGRPLRMFRYSTSAAAGAG